MTALPCITSAMTAGMTWWTSAPVRWAEWIGRSPPPSARAFAAQGVAVQIVVLASRLSDGQLLSNLVEVYAPSVTREHPGEEFVYVIDGAATITVGSTTVTLAAGESMVFRSAEPHVYAPAAGSAGPARLLMVRFDARVQAP